MDLQNKSGNFRLPSTTNSDNTKSGKKKLMRGFLLVFPSMKVYFLEIMELFHPS